MKPFKSFLMILTALLFNAIVGVSAAAAFDFSPLLGAISANALGLCLSLIPMPTGVMRAGVLREVWTGELIKALRAGDVATFLDGIPDYSQYAENDVIHLVDVGGDPSVLINNTTYPISVTAINDSDAAFSLDKFQTEATPITDDELFALSYDKMASVKERHSDAIKIAKFKKAIHALAPSSNANLIQTTGAYVNTTYGRRRITLADIINLKDKFDKMEVPIEGRRLVLCSDHVNDLLLLDQKFAQQYYNYNSGKIMNLYGFEIYEFVNCPYYSTAGVKKNIGAIVAAGEFQASVAFSLKRCFKATGTTKMYYSEAKTDPQNQRSLINFRHYFIVLPKKSEALGVITSTYTPQTVTPSLETSASSVPEFTKNGGVKHITVTSSSDAWTVANDNVADSWFTATKAGNQICVECSPNLETSAPARNGSFTVTNGTLTEVVTVSQAANS